MSFHEVSFPLIPDWGHVGGPGYDISIPVLDSGYEERFLRCGPKREYEVGTSIRSQADIVTLLNFFIARRGQAYGFRFKDLFDFTSKADGKSAPTATDQAVGIGNGTQIHFQLVKGTRIIEKPVDGTVLIAKDGVTLTTNDWFCNYTTGLVSFETAPANNVVVTAGYEFDVPVRFATDYLEVVEEHYLLETMLKVPLIELLDPGLTDGEFNYGGSQHLVYSGQVDLTLAYGKVLRLEPTANNIQVRLPNPADLEFGGPYFYLYRVDSTKNVLIRNYDGAAIYNMNSTLAQDEKCFAAIIFNNGDGTKRWGICDI